MAAACLLHKGGSDHESGPLSFQQIGPEGGKMCRDDEDNLTTNIVDDRRRGIVADVLENIHPSLPGTVECQPYRPRLALAAHGGSSKSTKAALFSSLCVGRRGGVQPRQ
jgi:hypothetical protein